MAAIEVARAAVGDYKLRAAPDSALANVRCAHCPVLVCMTVKICLTAVVSSSPVFNESCLTSQTGVRVYVCLGVATLKTSL